MLDSRRHLLQSLAALAAVLAGEPALSEQANQKKLRADVAKLLDMASELKQEVEKTDATSTLPLSVVKKAQQIEKLAKQIRDLAKG